MRTQMRTLTRLVILAAFSVTLLAGGCAKQRTLPKVRLDGDRALERQNFDKAEADYAEAVERDPGDYRHRVGLGRAFMGMEQYNNAREQFELAYAIRPDDPQVLEHLADSMLAAGADADLYDLLHTRAEARQTAEAWFLLGRYMVQAGDIDVAERALLTAARMDGGQTAEVQVALADFYESVGDRENALERLRMALYLDPENEDLMLRIREYGEVPGPSFALQPSEQD
jgi:Tfp pilus assembly protein PilF